MKEKMEQLLEGMASNLEQAKHDCECISDEEGYDNLSEAAGSITDALAEIYKHINPKTE